MGHFSVEIYAPTGSLLSGNQHAGVIREAAGDHAGHWSLKLGDMFFPKSPSAGAQYRDSITINNDGGMGAVIAFHAGHGRGDYPLFQLSDANGQTIGVLADFFIDNRPW